MNKILKWSLCYIVGIVLLLAIGLICLYYFGGQPDCCRAVDSSASSPNGDWLAQAAEESWGLSGGHYFVTLSQKQESEVVFDFMPPDSGPFNVRWLDSKHLEIEYPGSTETYKRLDSYRGISITYLECPVNKRGIGSKKCAR